MMKYRIGILFVATFLLAACQASKTGDLDVSADDAKLSEKAEVEKAENTSGEDKKKSVATEERTASVGELKEQSRSNAIVAYVPPEAGTVYTWRNNWANLPEIISYKVAGTRKVGGKEFLKLTSLKGFKSTTHAYYDTSDFSLKGYRDKDDKAVVTFKPTEQRYRFPMAPGDKWVTSWKQIEHKTSRVTSGGGVVKVLRWETVKTPAGDFRALKVRMPVQKGAPKGLTHHAWFSPELGITVKEEIGGGVLQWSQVLEKVERPG